MYNWYQSFPIMSLWSHFSVIQHSTSVCVESVRTVPAFHIFIPATCINIYIQFCFSFFFVLICASLCSGGALGPLHPLQIFCLLRFLGLGHMKNLFQGLLHLTCFQSPSPADLAGSEADLNSRTPQPGSGQSLGSKEMSWNEENEARLSMRILVCTPLLVLSNSSCPFLSYL